MQSVAVKFFALLVSFAVNSLCTATEYTLKRIKDPVVREKLPMVQAAYEMSLRDAAAKFGCTHGKIDFWKQCYEHEGVRGLYTRERSDRPPKKIPEDDPIS